MVTFIHARHVFSIHCLQSTHGDVHKRLPNATHVVELVTQLAALAEEGSLVEAEQSTKQLAEQVKDLLDRLTARKHALKEEYVALESRYIEFTSSTQEVTVWLDQAEEKLNESAKLSAEAQVSEDEIEMYKVGLSVGYDITQT